MEIEYKDAPPRIIPTTTTTILVRLKECKNAISCIFAFQYGPNPQDTQVLNIGWRQHNAVTEWQLLRMLALRYEGLQAGRLASPEGEAVLIILYELLDKVYWAKEDAPVPLDDVGDDNTNHVYRADTLNGSSIIQFQNSSGCGESSVNGVHDSDIVAAIHRLVCGAGISDGGPIGTGLSSLMYLMQSRRAKTIASRLGGAGQLASLRFSGTIDE